MKESHNEFIGATQKRQTERGLKSVSSGKSVERSTKNLTRMGAVKERTARSSASEAAGNPKVVFYNALRESLEKAQARDIAIKAEMAQARGLIDDLTFESTLLDVEMATLENQIEMLLRR